MATGEPAREDRARSLHRGAWSACSSDIDARGILGERARRLLASPIPDYEPAGASLQPVHAAAHDGATAQIERTRRVETCRQNSSHSEAPKIGPISALDSAPDFAPSTP